MPYTTLSSAPIAGAWRVGVLLVAALLVGCASATPSPSDDRVATLEAQVQGLEQRVTVVEQAATALPQPGATTGPAATPSAFMPVASAALVSYKDTASQSHSVLLPIQNTTMNPDLGLFINDRAEQLAILTLSASGSFTPTLYYAPGLLPEIDPAASTSIEIVRVVVPLTFDAAGAASEQPRTIQRPAQALSVVARELSIGSGATVGSLLQDNPILAAGRFMLLTPGGVSDWPGYQAYIIVSTPPDGSDSNLSPICYVCYIGICPSYCRTPA